MAYLHSEARKQSIREGAPVPPPPRIALHGPHHMEPPRSASDHVVQIAPPPIMEARIAPSRTVQPQAMLPWTTPHRNVALLASMSLQTCCLGSRVLFARLACMCTTEVGAASDRAARIAPPGIMEPWIASSQTMLPRTAPPQTCHCWCVAGDLLSGLPVCSVVVVCVLRFTIK